jgi:hypothetical protein
LFPDLVNLAFLSAALTWGIVNFRPKLSKQQQ